MAGQAQPTACSEDQSQMRVLIFRPCGMNGLVEVVVLASRLGLEPESFETHGGRAVMRVATTRQKTQRLLALARQSVAVQSAELAEL